MEEAVHHPFTVLSPPTAMMRSWPARSASREIGRVHAFCVNALDVPTAPRTACAMPSKGARSRWRTAD
jgi:hypothetical protein